MVFACTAIGARVFAGADDTVSVLVAADDIGAGQELTGDLVHTRDMRLGDNTERYVTGPVGDGYVAQRDVGAGELLPRSAITAADDLAHPVRYVAVAMPAAELPTSVTAGSVVDVWVAPPGGGKAAKRLVRDVRVSAVSGDSAGALGVDGSAVTITLALTTARVGDEARLNETVGKLVSAGREGRIYLAKLPAEGS